MPIPDDLQGFFETLCPVVEDGKIPLPSLPPPQSAPALPLVLPELIGSDLPAISDGLTDPSPLPAAMGAAIEKKAAMPVSSVFHHAVLAGPAENVPLPFSVAKDPAPEQALSSGQPELSAPRQPNRPSDLAMPEVAPLTVPMLPMPVAPPAAGLGQEALPVAGPAVASPEAGPRLTDGTASVESEPPMTTPFETLLRPPANFAQADVAPPDIPTEQVLPDTVLVQPKATGGPLPTVRPSLKLGVSPPLPALGGQILPVHAAQTLPTAWQPHGEPADDPSAMGWVTESVLPARQKPAATADPEDGADLEPQGAVSQPHDAVDRVQTAASKAVMVPPASLLSPTSGQHATEPAQAPDSPPAAQGPGLRISVPDASSPLAAPQNGNATAETLPPLHAALNVQTIETETGWGPGDVEREPMPPEPTGGTPRTSWASAETGPRDRSSPIRDLAPQPVPGDADSKPSVPAARVVMPESLALPPQSKDDLATFAPISSRPAEQPPASPERQPDGAVQTASVSPHAAVPAIPPMPMPSAGVEPESPAPAAKLPPSEPRQVQIRSPMQVMIEFQSRLDRSPLGAPKGATADTPADPASVPEAQSGEDNASTLVETPHRALPEERAANTAAAPGRPFSLKGVAGIVAPRHPAGVETPETEALLGPSPRLVRGAGMTEPRRSALPEGQPTPAAVPQERSLGPTPTPVIDETLRMRDQVPSTVPIPARDPDPSRPEPRQPASIEVSRVAETIAPPRRARDAAPLEALPPAAAGARPPQPKPDTSVPAARPSVIPVHALSPSSPGEISRPATAVTARDAAPGRAPVQASSQILAGASPRILPEEQVVPVVPKAEAPMPYPLGLSLSPVEPAAHPSQRVDPASQPPQPVGEVPAPQAPPPPSAPSVHRSGPPLAEPGRILPARTPKSLVQSIAGSGRSRAEIVLEPAELGKMRFDLVTHGDRVQVTLIVERPETLDLMRRHVEELRQEFRAAGFDTGALSFSQWNQSDEGRQNLPQFPLRDAGDDPAPLPSAPTPSARATGAGLDLRL